MACKIHEATRNNKRPALDGLFDTLQKRCKTSELGDYILQNNPVTKYVVHNIQKKEINNFESSHLNKLRSIAVYYNYGVMGKRKYQAVRLASSIMASNKKRGGKTAIKYLSSCSIPKRLTYNNLMKEINSIDIGKVYSVNVFSPSFEEEDSIRGSFRDLGEYLPRLACFYLRSKSRKDNLKWFGETEGTFKIAFGGMVALLVRIEQLVLFLLVFSMWE